MSSDIRGREVSFVIFDEMEDIVMANRTKKTEHRKRGEGGKADARKLRYLAKQFGYILLSNTESIVNNTELQESLGDEVLVDLLSPIFHRFFETRGSKWELTGPGKLATVNPDNLDEWKTASALGGEILEFAHVGIGKRDGVCVRWNCNNIVGTSAKGNILVDTTIKGFGDMLVPANAKGNPANRESFLNDLLIQFGKTDVVQAAKEAATASKEAARLEVVAEILRKTEAYGETFGTWA